jgi:hypothetical protein
MSRGFGVYYMQLNQLDHFRVVFKEKTMILAPALVSIDTVEISAQLWSSFIYRASIIISEIHTFAIFIWQTPLTLFQTIF